MSTGLVYDPKRKLIWLAHGAGRAGEVFVLRPDAAAGEVTPVAGRKWNHGE